MNYIRLYTLSKREVLRFLKVWTQTLSSPVIIALLYFAVFGGALSSQITDIPGTSYLAFILPGLMMMQSTANAYQNPSSSLIIAKYHGNIKDLLVAPFSAMEKTLGYIIGAVIRGLITATIIGVVGAFFIENFSIHSFSWLFIIFFLANAIFGIIGSLAGLWAKSFDQSQGIANFLIIPMGFLGGVFYSLEMLPAWAQTISHVNPMVYMVDGARYAFFGESSIDILTSFTILMMITIILFVLNYLAFRVNWGLKE